jgi:hypothetical protein
VIDFGLGGDDLVEQLAGSVLLASLGVALADRERLAERAALPGSIASSSSTSASTSACASSLCTVRR